MVKRAYGSGSIVEKAPNVFQVRAEAPRDPLTGRRHRITVTVRGPKKAAQEKLTELQGKVYAGEARTTATTVGELVAKSMTTRQLEQRTREDWDQVLRDYVLPGLGAVQLRKLTAVRLDQHYAALRRDGVTPYRVLRAHEIISAVCADAVRWGWLARNPAGTANRPRRPAKRSRSYSEAAVTAVDKPAAEHQVWGLFYLLASLLGARSGELCALTWRKVDLDAGTITFDQAASKTKSGVIVKATKTAEWRTVYVDSETLELLRARRLAHAQKLLGMGRKLTGDQFVFTHRGNAWGDRPVSPQTPTHWWGRLRNAAGAREIRLYDLRHLASSGMLADGIEVQTVAEIIGNKPETLLGNYAHVLAGRKKAAAEAAAARVRSRRRAS